jgi:fatty acid desaturase
MNLADADERVATERRRFPFWAVVLVLIGLFALLANLNIIPGLNWDIFWPVLLIIIGVSGFLEYYYYRK